MVLAACSSFSATPHALGVAQPGDQFGGGEVAPRPIHTPQTEPPRADGSDEEAVRGELYALARAQAEYRARNGTYARGLRPDFAPPRDYVRAPELAHCERRN
ncbi:MAG: hypothetical protein OEU54_15055 [Gemmatimonadota bacterium]|nr:hypothetical protein [Gemmatimonadota bacterium]